jgi:uncharacterized protein (TIGR02270 family)
VPPPLLLDLLEQHAIEAAFAWAARDAAATAPHYDRRALAAVDERLEAHLDGLRVGGLDGLAAAERALDPAEPGTIFTLTVLALEQGDAVRSQAVLDLGAKEHATARALVAALAWLPHARARDTIEALLAKDSPATRRRIGLAAAAAHRQDPGPALVHAVFSDDARLKARGLRACLELGRIDLVEGVREGLTSPDAEVRFWAAAAALVLGDDGAARPLWSLAADGGPFAARACALAVRKLEVRDARERLEGLAARPEHARTAASGAGALGDPSLVPWLLGAMNEPVVARAAGEAFAAITGAELTGALAGAAPPGFHAGPSDDPRDEDVAMDPDLPLAWPAAEACAVWWAERSGRFRRGVRHLRGARLSEESLQRELEQGSQRARASAALELALRKPGGALLEVRGRAAAPFTAPLIAR